MTQFLDHWCSPGVIIINMHYHRESTTLQRLHWPRVNVMSSNYSWDSFVRTKLIKLGRLALDKCKLEDELLLIISLWWSAVEGMYPWKRVLHLVCKFSRACAQCVSCNCNGGLLFSHCKLHTIHIDMWLWLNIPANVSESLCTICRIHSCRYEWWFICGSTQDFFY